MTLGFHNYDIPSVSPLSLVVDSPAEDVNSRTLLTEYCDRYYKNNVHKSFNISLLEFLDCPKALADELLELSQGIAGTESRTLAEIQANIEKQANK